MQLARVAGRHGLLAVGFLGALLSVPGVVATLPEVGVDVGSPPVVLCQSASSLNTYNLVCAAETTALEAPSEAGPAADCVIFGVPPAESPTCVLPIAEPVLGTTVDYVWCYLAEQPPLNWFVCV